MTDRRSAQVWLAAAIAGVLVTVPWLIPMSLWAWLQEW